MGRIRTIKPEFFVDVKLNDLEEQFPELRPMVVYVGLFCQCDSNGVFKWEPRPLRREIMPWVTYDLAKSLDLLLEHGFIESFNHADLRYGIILKFRTHQAIQANELSYINDIQSYVIPPEIMEKIPEKQRAKINISPFKNSVIKPSGEELKPNDEVFVMIPPLSKIEEFKNKMLGELWIESACVTHSLDKEKFTEFIKTWVETRILTESKIYSFGQMRTYAIDDFKKTIKDNTNGKSVTKKRTTYADF